MNNYLKVFGPVILTIAIGFTSGKALGELIKPQNPKAPTVKLIDFKHIGNIESFYAPGNYPAKMFKLDLPNKQGYITAILAPDGNISTTYIPRDVSWDVK